MNESNVVAPDVKTSRGFSDTSIKKGCFVVEPVGQGMFYTGYIEGDKPFNFVYDCGTSSRNKKARKKIIDNYIKSMLGDSDLDMLVISHFDNDHINGIPELLRNRGVKHLFLPYCSHDDYLMLVTWLYAFSLEQKMDSIIFVSETELNSEKDSTKEVNENSFEDINMFSTEYIESKTSMKYGILGNIKIEDGIINKKLRMMSNTKIKLNDKTFSSAIWEFKFFNNPISNKDRQMVNQEIEKLKKRTLCKTLEELIKKLNEKTEITSEEMIGIRQEFRKIYNEISSLKKREHINQTSLCLYHGPVFDPVRTNIINPLGIWLCHGNNGNSRFYSSCDVIAVVNRADRYKCLICANKVEDGVLCEDKKKYYGQCNLLGSEELGTLLTGDISLQDSCNEFKEFYKGELSKVFFFQIPHHGASSSWSKDFMTNISFPRYFVSFGKKNSYGHPSPELCYCLGRENRTLIFVNEEKTLVYHILLCISGEEQ